MIHPRIQPRWPWGVLATTVAFVAAMSAGCARDRRDAARLAVRSLVAAPEDKAAGELDKVVSFGALALADIEQEFHSADARGRLRLLDALEKLALPQARPLLEVIARGAQEEEVQDRARHVLARLPGRGKTP